MAAVSVAGLGISRRGYLFLEAAGVFNCSPVPPSGLVKGAQQAPLGYPWGREAPPTSCFVAFSTSTVHHEAFLKNHGLSKGEGLAKGKREDEEALKKQEEHNGKFTTHGDVADVAAVVQ